MRVGRKMPRPLVDCGRCWNSGWKGGGQQMGQRTKPTHLHHNSGPFFQVKTKTILSTKVKEENEEVKRKGGGDERIEIQNLSNPGVGERRELREKGNA